MPRLIVMPKLGLTMSEGKVAKWHKQEGDVVKTGDIILEVETDKLTNEVEADQDGVIRKIFVEEGASALVKEPLAILAGADEDISDLFEGKEETKEEETKEIEVKPENDQPKAIREKGEYIKATPYAKRLAKEKDINLEEVVGTGEEGRIIGKNILDFEKEGRVKASPTAAKMAKDLRVELSTVKTDGRIMKEDVLASMTGKIPSQENMVETVAASSMRKIIATRMLENWNTIPSVSFDIEVDVSKMIELRESLKGQLEKAGVKLSYNHILMKIVSKVLLEVPYLNASFDGEEINYHYYTNIGLAVAVEEGLLVPNIKNVQNKTLTEIAKETEEKINQAREGSLSPDDLTGGTFTITNLGMYGIDSFSPIINKPEVAILGVNRMVEKPVVVDGEITIKPMMKFSLTADHSLVDGAAAAQFLARFKELIENPYILLS